MPEDPLAQLPPIHLPEPISFWPPAIGWWLLAAFVIALCFLVIKLLIKHRHRNRLRKAALAELTRHWQAYEKDNKAEDYVLAVNRLLKQFVQQQYPEKNLHTLSGAQWLKALQALSPQSTISSDSAAVLLNIYRPQPQYDERSVSSLYPTLMHWFKGLSLAS